MKNNQDTNPGDAGPSDEPNSNRTFLVAASALGGILFVSCICVGILFFLGQNTNAQHATGTQISGALTSQALTSTYAMSSSLTDTPLPIDTPTAVGIESPTSTPTATVGAMFTQVAISTVITSTSTPAEMISTATETNQPSPSSTPAPPNPTLSVDEQFAQVEAELKRSMTGSFSYMAPATMKLDDTFIIQLLINPSLSPDELATKIVESSGLATSTMEPGELVTNDGAAVNVISDRIEITPRMKAALMLEDLQAFDVQRLNDDDIQFVSATTPTEWQWAIKARKVGDQRIIILISRLVKIDGVESWRPVETYKADINVKVTALQRVSSLDWRWILTPIIGAALTWWAAWFWRRYDERKKKNSADPEAEPKKTTKPPQKRKRG